MADKILRPITDVEIVEKMGENDTVLIEHDGEIKRAKGVAGGGLNIVVNYDYISEAESETITIENTTYDELKAAILSGTPINAKGVFLTDGVIEGCCVISGMFVGMFYDSESDTETECIWIANVLSNEFAILPDGTAKYPN